jgi:RimJ/RimL family protein N-acetyltransferase
VGALPAPPVAAPLADRTTERLDLRRFARSDRNELVDVFSHREVWEFPYGRAFDAEETEQFLERRIAEWDELGVGLWVARTREDQRMIGYVGLSVPTFFPEILPAFEVGWRFTPQVWGRGYATEGAAAALDDAFRVLQLRSVCSLPQVDNPRSVRVAERLGMRRTRDAVLAATDLRAGVTVAVFEIDGDDWRARGADSEED